MDKFLVIRHHTGDVEYFPGDIRVASAVEVQHLIGAVLEPVKAGKVPTKRAAK